MRRPLSRCVDSRRAMSTLCADIEGRAQSFGACAFRLPQGVRPYGVDVRTELQAWSARPCLRACGIGAVLHPALAQRGPAIGRAHGREADRRRRQHLHDPDCQGPRRRPAAESSQGLALRGFLRGLLQQEGRPRASLRAQGLLARLGLRHRRQRGPRRHQQSRHRRCRRDRRQLPRRLEAQGRQGDRPRQQGRSGAPQGHTQEAARRRPLRLVRRHEGRRLGDGHRQSVRPRRHA